MRLSVKTKLYVAQAGTCCYCDKPMLITGDMTVKRFGAIYGLTRRQAAQRVASEGYRKVARGADINTVPLDANMAIARGLRKQIEQRADVGPLNEQTQRLMGVERALDDAMGRISNNQPIGMNALIAAGAGSATGLASQDPGVGGTVGLGILALTNPWLASRLAIAADRMAPAVGQIPNAARTAALIQQLSEQEP